MKKYLLFAVLVAVFGVGSIAYAYARESVQDREKASVRKAVVLQCNVAFTTARQSYKDAIKKAEAVAKDAKKSAEATYKASAKDEVARAVFKNAKESAKKTLVASKESARSTLKVSTTAHNACVRSNKK